MSKPVVDVSVAPAPRDDILCSVVSDTDDMPAMDVVAGIEHLGVSAAESVDVLLTVVEQYYKSLETGWRTPELQRS